MKKVLPHEYFRLDFDQMLEEGKRQEQIHSANQGEYSLVKDMHTYFAKKVLPLIIHNDWVFEAASDFASDYAIDCFHYLRLGGQEIYNTQQRLLQINEQIVDFLARASIAGYASVTEDLVKASDFIRYVEVDKLSKEMQSKAKELLELAKDHELLQLIVTLRAIRDNYETTLPRIMYVVRRAIKVDLGLPAKNSDYEITGISEYISWYNNRIGSNHELYPVLGNLTGFYKIARNVESHHQSLKWEAATNEVILEDKNDVLRIPVHEFQKKYRYLIYLCELGVRGILSSFCERERGAISNNLIGEYEKTFPEGFPDGEMGIVKLYTHN